MLFNTIQYAYFLPVVFALYWYAQKAGVKVQNLILLVASYYFYACWDWRFLFLLVFSTSLDYFTGLRMSDSKTSFDRKIWFWLSIVINLGFLGVFKYFNFFADSFADLLNNAGFQVNPWSLKIILPVGISFYTFHGLSYVIDVYKDRIPPERDFINYSVFVSFFPLLVAGPIERATHLLPQINSKRDFNYTRAVDGLRQILWGLVKKIVIADTCAVYANMVFNDSGDLTGSEVLLGAIFFAFQIYGDFSGYTDIALGTARLFGIELLRNFAYPYFSRDIAEFWRRWHISLSTWFRDYLYIPLGGSKGSVWLKIRNTFIIFIVSGFWHGANWTFIAWGALHAFYFLPLLLAEKNRSNLDIVAKGRMLPTFKETFGMITTFVLVTFAWIFFRADSMSHAMQLVGVLFSGSLFTIPVMLPKLNIVLIVLFVIMEWRGREHPYAIAVTGTRYPRGFRWSIYFIMLAFILVFSGKGQEFIYFQF